MVDKLTKDEFWLLTTRRTELEDHHIARLSDYFYNGWRCAMNFVEREMLAIVTMGSETVINSPSQNNINAVFQLVDMNKNHAEVDLMVLTYDKRNDKTIVRLYDEIINYRFYEDIDYQADYRLFLKLEDLVDGVEYFSDYLVDKLGNVPVADLKPDLELASPLILCDDRWTYDPGLVTTTALENKQLLCVQQRGVGEVGEAVKLKKYSLTENMIENQTTLSADFYIMLAYYSPLRDYKEMPNVDPLTQSQGFHATFPLNIVSIIKAWRGYYSDYDSDYDGGYDNDIDNCYTSHLWILLGRLQEADCVKYFYLISSCNCTVDSFRHNLYICDDYDTLLDCAVSTMVKCRYLDLKHLCRRNSR